MYDNRSITNEMSQSFAIVILAAGASTQRGRPKQLLPYLGKTLVEHAARTAIASGADEIIVVVGSEAASIRKLLIGLPIRIVRNREWTEGISSSIRCGIGAVRRDIKCAVIALCDQPRITPELLRSLASRHFATGCPIVASSYDGVVGAPCAFGVDLFPTLNGLRGAAGAREVIRHSLESVETLEFSEGNVDVDPPTEFAGAISTVEVKSYRDEYQEPQFARGPPRASLACSSPA